MKLSKTSLFILGWLMVLIVAPLVALKYLLVTHGS
jgi:hypothetical protein